MRALIQHDTQCHGDWQSENRVCILLHTNTKYIHTHTESLVNRLTVPVASLIKQWQLYHRPDKQVCAKRDEGRLNKKKKECERKDPDKEIEGAEACRKAVNKTDLAKKKKGEGEREILFKP